jgi:hypothetical protein
MLKYYASNTRLLNYRVPDDLDERLEGAIKDARGDVRDLLEKLLEDHGEEIKEVAEALKPCPHCSTQHFIEYVLVHVLNRALAEGLQEAEI